MINNIRLCLRHQGRVSNKTKIKFKPGLNVIVGSNGSGKSSLLKAIYECKNCKQNITNETNYHYFNSETMNPHKSEENFKGIVGSIIKVRAMFSSHGETMRDVLRYMSFKSGDCLLLDEPETGHDLNWIIKIRKGLDEISKSGSQIIIASHHPVFFNNINKIELTENHIFNTRKKFKKIIN